MASKALVLLVLLLMMTPGGCQTNSLITYLFYSFGTAAGDSLLPSADDSYSNSLACDIGFPFFGNSSKNVFVSVTTCNYDQMFTFLS